MTLPSPPEAKGKTGPAIKIRRAGPGDIDSLTNLLKILFTIEADFTFNQSRQQAGLHLLLANAACCVLVAVIDDHAVGDRVVGMCSGQLTMSTAEGGPALLVEDVVVEEKWRHRGIGRRLLDRLARWAADQGARRLQLLADRNNTAALNFYNKLGWQPTQLICLRKRPLP